MQYTAIKFKLFFQIKINLSSLSFIENFLSNHPARSVGHVEVAE
jgi:hypothetical protein